MTVLVAVFRRPEMLKALLCERLPSDDTEEGRSKNPYVERVVPLSALPDAMCPWRDADIRAWRSLGKVPNLSKKAVKAVIRCLLSTVTDPDFNASDFEASEASEFSFERGAIDMRPLLCNPAGENRVLSALGDAVPGKAEHSELPSWHWTHRSELAELPAGFRRHFLWGLSLAPWSQVELMLAVHESLNLAKAPALSLAVARLATVGSREATLWWCDVLADLPEANRLRGVRHVLEAGAHSIAPTDKVRAAMIAEDWKQAAHSLAILVP